MVMLSEKPPCVKVYKSFHFFSSIPEKITRRTLQYHRDCEASPDKSAENLHATGEHASPVEHYAPALVGGHCENSGLRLSAQRAEIFSG